MSRRTAVTCAIALALAASATGQPPSPREKARRRIAPFSSPPPKLAKDLGGYRSPLLFDDGSRVGSAADWPRRRKQILANWHEAMGPWPALLAKPIIETTETRRREGFTQRKVDVEIAPGLKTRGYLLVPDGGGPLPAVLVAYYDPETGAGLKPESKLRDFGYRLTKRGFVTLSIGWPRKESDRRGGEVQPLSFLAYVAANCHTALARLDEVDAARIGVTGHSFGGKWAMFAAALYEKFAAAAVSDSGVVFDEKRANVNYWERWYLGAEPGPGPGRKPGIPSKANPRTGAYKKLVDAGRDLHELHALIAPRPFLVSGGAEDRPERWKALNHSLAVNKLLGFDNRVAMTNRRGHSPTAESNEQLYAFFELFLKHKRGR